VRALELIDGWGATHAAAAVVAPDGAARVVVGGVGDRPLRFDGEARELPATVESAVEPEDDAFVSARFRRRLAGVCAERALAEAQEKVA
jgi:CO/xanthine dehydrogenase FAD-binding subunit